MKIEIILAEFGGQRANAGDARLPVYDRLEPSLSSWRKHFPEATVTVYTDQNWPDTREYRVVRVKPPFHRHSLRWGNRCNDYYKGYGLMQSQAEIAIAIDSDMVIVNPDVRTLIPLTMKFGMCMPSNGRRLVWKDAASTCDGGPVKDETLGMGMCRCTALWSLRTDSAPHATLIDRYCRQLIVDAETNAGARGPLSLWRAEWETGISPYGLPAEWCITGSTLGEIRKKDRIIPVVLHVGHEAVAKQYAELL